MNRKVLAIIALGIISILAITGVSYAVSPQEQARIAAEEGLPMLLKNIAEPEPQLFYFSNKDEVMRATLGTPLENFTITEGNFDEGKSVDEQMKPYPFYVFPLVVDGRVTTDLTVALQNGKWEVIDIGGCLNKNIHEVSKNNNLTASKVLRFAGKTFVLAKKGDSEVAYSPYNDPAGLKSGVLMSPDEFKVTLAKRQREVLEFKGKDLLGGNVSTAPLEFKQDSIYERLIRFVRHKYFL